MFTRRGVLLASIAAGVIMPNRNALAKASRPSTMVRQTRIAANAFSLPPE